MSLKLHVANLALTTTEDDLRDVFGVFGTITEVFVGTERMGGQQTGFALVTFSTITERRFAAEKLHGMQLDGHLISVTVALPHQDRAEGGGSRNPIARPSQGRGEA